MNAINLRKGVPLNERFLLWLSAAADLKPGEIAPWWWRVVVFLVEPIRVSRIYLADASFYDAKSDSFVIDGMHISRQWFKRLRYAREDQWFRIVDVTKDGRVVMEVQSEESMMERFIKKYADPENKKVVGVISKINLN